MTLACVFGCQGTALTPDERAFFAEVRPWGFILFGRNIATPAQVRALTDSLRSVAERNDTPVLIDQEGGRVRRLKPPHWPHRPAAGRLGAFPADLAGRAGWTRLNARAIAADLRSLGVTVNCAPVCDVRSAGGSDVIGDRAFAEDAETVAVLARATAEGLIAGGVLPVVKHIPGHGRAPCDSHHALPVVEAPLADLEAVDFSPFWALRDMPIAMTAHVVFAAVDPSGPATTSRAVIDAVIRGAIGFDGLLLSDDLAMDALAGDLENRARGALQAGCDVALYGGGGLAAMTAVARGSRALDGRSAARADLALARIPAVIEPFDAVGANARLAAAFGGAA